MSVVEAILFGLLAGAVGTAVVTVVQLIEIGGVGAISVVTAFQNLSQMPLTGTDEMLAGMPEANAGLVGAGVRRQPEAPLRPSGPR